MSSASDHSDTSILGRTKGPMQAQTLPEGELPPPAAFKEREREPSFVFRGFDYFANRDFIDLKKNATKGAAGAGALNEKRASVSWLRGPTPPPENPLEGSPDAGGRLGNSPEDQTPKSEKRICGLRRSRFWILLAAVVILLIIAIGVGAGVGATRGSSTKASGAEAVESSSPSQSPTATGSSKPSSTFKPETSTTTTTTTSPTSTPTGTPGAQVDCPAVNGTVYSVPGSEKSFLRLCGIDFSGDNQATDIRNVPTETMLDCIKNCAGTKDCTGSSWGYIEGDTGTQHTCWMKTDLIVPHETDASWSFAVLL